MKATDPGVQDPDTASEARSIWADVERDALERHVQVLFKRQHIADRRNYVLPAEPRDSLYPLPLAIEGSLADDFAFIAASQPEVGFVTAATIEQVQNESSLLVRLAANEGVSVEVSNRFNELFEVLRKHARKGILSELFQLCLGFADFMHKKSIESLVRHNSTT